MAIKAGNATAQNIFMEKNASIFHPAILCLVALKTNVLLMSQKLPGRNHNCCFSNRNLYFKCSRIYDFFLKKAILYALACAI